jgi:hypothetical protein
MIALIKQPAGIGDIFFCQKIASKLGNAGYNVVWPVIPEFLWLKDYLISDVTFCNVLNDFESKKLYEQCNLTNNICNYNEDGGVVAINLQAADRLFLSTSVMTAKYKAMQLKHENWLEYFNFKRNIKKENELFYDVLKLNDNSQYALKNYFFASPPDEQVCRLAVNANIQCNEVVTMRNIENFTLFDWCKVIQHAQEIHSVDTSVILIVEKINTTDNIYLYSRHTPANFMHVTPILSKKWNLIYD